MVTHAARSLCHSHRYVSAMVTRDTHQNSCHIPPTLIVCVLYMSCSLACSSEVHNDAPVCICPNMVLLHVAFSLHGFPMTVYACVFDDIERQKQ